MYSYTHYGRDNNYRLKHVICVSLLCSDVASQHNVYKSLRAIGKVTKAEQFGKKMTSKCKHCCYGFMWFLLLIFFVWWFSLFAGCAHCLIAPFAACCHCSEKIMNLTLKLVRLPYYVSRFMVEGKSLKQAVVSTVLFE